MDQNFSFKAFFIALVILSLLMFGFVYSKSEAYKKSLDILHSIIIPIEEMVTDESINQDTQEVIVEDINTENTEDSIESEIVESAPPPADIDIIDNPRALISVIVYDYGLSSKLSEKVFETGIKNLSVALSPYADNASEWIDMAYRFEGEPWASLYVHKSSLTNKDYGPLAVLEGLNKEINDKRTAEVLKSRRGSQGVVTFYDGRTSSKELAGVFKKVKQEQLPMVLLSEVSLFDKDDALHSSNVLLYNQRAEEVTEFFNSVKARAFISGKAIVAIPPTPFVLAEMSKWVEELQRESMQIVPLSVLLGR